MRDRTTSSQSKTTPSYSNIMEIAEDTNENSKTKSFTLWQVYVISCILLNNISMGAVLGFMTIIQAQENLAGKSNDRNFFLWFVSIPIIMELPTMIIVPAVMQKKGRKAASYLVVAPMAIAWMLMYFSSSNIIMLIARTFQGFSFGGIVSVTSVLVSEYSTPELRGIFLMFGSVLTFSGIWLANLLGTFLKWRTVSLILGIISIFNFVSIFTWPESPSWLAMKGYEVKCRKIFYKLRGKSKRAEAEINDLLDAQKKQIYQKRSQASLFSFKGFKDKVTAKDFYKPLFGICVLLSLHTSHGKIAITVFAIQFYTEMTGSVSEAYVLLSVYDIATIIGLIIGCFLVKVLPRKVLLISSAVIAVVCLLATSFFMYFVRIGLLSTNFNMASVVCMFIYMLGTSLGCSSAPIFMGELIPIRHRGSVDSLGSVYSVIIALVVANINPILVDNYQSLGILLSSAILTFPCIFLLYYHLPETKDKTLQEIEDYFLCEKKETQNTAETEMLKISTI